MSKSYFDMEREFKTQSKNDPKFPEKAQELMPI